MGKYLQRLSFIAPVNALWLHINHQPYASLTQFKKNYLSTEKFHTLSKVYKNTFTHIICSLIRFMFGSPLRI
jgi:hypothetical protein